MCVPDRNDGSGQMQTLQSAELRKCKYRRLRVSVAPKSRHKKNVSAQVGDLEWPITQYKKTPVAGVLMPLVRRISPKVWSDMPVQNQKFGAICQFKPALN